MGANTDIGQFGIRSKRILQLQEEKRASRLSVKTNSAAAGVSSSFEGLLLLTSGRISGAILVPAQVVGCVLGPDLTDTESTLQDSFDALFRSDTRAHSIISVIDASVGRQPPRLWTVPASRWTIGVRLSSLVTLFTGWTM